MIESFNGLYKWELIYPDGPWQGIEHVEFATLEYVDWFNHRRRHGEILPGRRQFTTPTAHEAAYYRHNVTADPGGDSINRASTEPGVIHPQPFIWHKTADQIIEKVRRGRAALSVVTKSATHH